MENLKITPVSVIRRDGRSLLLLEAEVSAAGHYILTLREGAEDRGRYPFALNSGRSFAYIWAEPPQEAYTAEAQITDRRGNPAAKAEFYFPVPRKWTFYAMVSSHIDLGLHNSQYIQRRDTAKFFRSALALYEKTEARPEDARYRYVAEGTWAYNNFREEYPEQEAEAIRRIREGAMGVCAGVAGNHFQIFGEEQMCRSAYSRPWLAEKGIPCKTMTIIDNPGIRWSMLQPYADAGYENIIFAPNNWGPHPSSVWSMDGSKEWYQNNPEACGGGVRIDVRYESALPMLFYLEGVAGRKMLVWACPQYGVGGQRFGISTGESPPARILQAMTRMLPMLEQRYPYDIWLFENYYDNQPPELAFADSLAQWNEQFQYPRIRTLGDPDEPFRLVQERFGEQIPTLSGEITNGWTLHPAAAAAVLADSFQADRMLPTAEKLASLAALYTDYSYPATEFEQAWAALIMNDEHSYGVGEYYGRDVLETWMQHRSWVRLSLDCAQRETDRALRSLARAAAGQGERVFSFNPTGRQRRELITTEKGSALVTLPPFGYCVTPAEAFIQEQPESTQTQEPPTVENDFYRVRFAPNGAMEEIFDKELGQLLNEGPCNEMLYTRDNHRSFHAPEKAAFTLERSSTGITVTAVSTHPVSGAMLTRRVWLPAYEKRIDIDNRVDHARDLMVADRTDRSRYDRHLYFAFPFRVPRCRRFCELGGCIGEYGRDLTGHSTDTYMAARKYALSENDEFGVALLQQDSQVIEFDRIHADKTDYGDPGEGSGIFSLVSTAWFHHKHLPGPEALNFRFRYSIYSYRGSHREAGVEELARRLESPVVSVFLSEKTEGPLPPVSHSFLRSNWEVVNLKRAQRGDGLILRLYSPAPAEPRLQCAIAEVSHWEPVTVTEQPRLDPPDPAGFLTLHLTGEDLHLKLREPEVPDPLAVGGDCTGLISSPCAASAYDCDGGTLFLLWGRCMRRDIAHYELYRSRDADFIPGEETFLAAVEPEEFVQGRYIDRGLAPDTVYYYRLRAVAKNGDTGPFSESFCGMTNPRQ